MIISWKAVYPILERYYTHRDLPEVIGDVSENFTGATETAQEMEDYLFLHHMITARENNSQKYCFFWHRGDYMPILLERNKNFTIDSLAKFFVDIDIGDEDVKSQFVDLIANIADRDGYDVAEKLDLFHKLVDERISLIKLHSGKVGANEQCPCGSNKKYKYCHGRKNKAAPSE